jgi:hypothetical protein
LLVVQVKYTRRQALRVARLDENMPGPRYMIGDLMIFSGFLIFLRHVQTCSNSWIALALAVQQHL